MEKINIESLSNPNNPKFCGFKDEKQWYTCSSAVYEFLSKKVPCSATIEETDGDTVTRIKVEKQNTPNNFTYLTSIKEDSDAIKQTMIIKQSSLNRAIETVSLVLANNPEEAKIKRNTQEMIEWILKIADEFTKYVKKELKTVG